MEPQSFYFDFTDNSSKDASINALLNAFVAAREKAKFRTNSKGFDEDVNLYIAHLLYAVSMPNYNAVTEQYLSLNHSEITVLADMAEDKYLKYFIYKVNADNLFIHLGILNDLHYKKHVKDQQKERGAFVEDAKKYYEAAANLNKKIYHRKTAVSDVLMKIAKTFSLYVKVLGFLRKDFYYFLNKHEDAEFSNFLSGMKSYERKVELEHKQNLFLDLYNQWLANRDALLKTKINALCKELHDLDPLFSFKLD